MVRGRGQEGMGWLARAAVREADLHRRRELGVSGSVAPRSGSFGGRAVSWCRRGRRGTPPVIRACRATS